MASPSQSLRSLTHLILEARSSQANILGTDHEPAHWTSYGRLIPNILRIAATLEDLPESLDHFDEQSLGESSVVLINRLGVGFEEARAILEVTLAMVQAIFESAVEQAENIVGVVSEQVAAPAPAEDAGDADAEKDAGEDEGKDKDETPATEPPADPSNPAEVSPVVPVDGPVEESGVTNAPDVGGAPDEATGDTPAEGEGATASGDEQAPSADAPTSSEPIVSAGENTSSPEPVADSSEPEQPAQADAPTLEPEQPTEPAPASEPEQPALPTESAASEDQEPAVPTEPAADEDKDKLPS